MEEALGDRVVETAPGRLVLGMRAIHRPVRLRASDSGRQTPAELRDLWQKSWAATSAGKLARGLAGVLEAQPGQALDSSHLSVVSCEFLAILDRFRALARYADAQHRSLAVTSAAGFFVVTNDLHYVVKPEWPGVPELGDRVGVTLDAGMAE